MNKDISIVENSDMDCDDSTYISKNLTNFNFTIAPPHQNPPVEVVNLILKNSNEEIVGGVLGVMGRACYYLEYLWISENSRSLGYGQLLLNKIENKVKAKGCKIITLDTFEFQAPEFYIKHGYQIFGILDIPEETKKYYLKKIL